MSYMTLLTSYFFVFRDVTVRSDGERGGPVPAADRQQGIDVRHVRGRARSDQPARATQATAGEHTERPHG